MSKFKAYGKKLKSLNEMAIQKKVCLRFEDCEKVPVFFVLLLNERKNLINNKWFMLWTLAGVSLLWMWSLT